MRRPTSETGDRLPGVVQPDIVLPVQFFTRPSDRATWSGAHRLLAALLEDAVLTCSSVPRSPNPKRSHLVREALRWMRSDDRTWVFSFLGVCEMLDLDPGAIRRGVRIRSATSAWRTDDLARLGGRTRRRAAPPRRRQ